MKGKKITAASFALAMLFCFCGVVTVSGLWKIYDMAQAYEQSAPDGVARALVTAFEKGEYQKLADLGEVEISPYEVENPLGQIWGESLQNVNYSEKQLNVYEIKSQEKLLATASLRSLKGEGKFGFDLWALDKLKLNIPAQQSVLVEVPKGCTVKINGKSCVEKGIDAPKTEFKFGEINPPITTNYKLENFLIDPKITVEKDDKALVTVESTAKVTAYFPIDSWVTGELESLAENSTKDYANFVSNDKKFDDIKGYFLPGTLFYKNLSQFYNGWYIPHDGFAFEGYASRNWLALNEEHIKCQVSFNYVIKKGYHSYEYPSVYNLHIVKTAQGYKIADLGIA